MIAIAHIGYPCQARPAMHRPYDENIPGAAADCAGSLVKQRSTNQRDSIQNSPAMRQLVKASVYDLNGRDGALARRSNRGLP